MITRLSALLAAVIFLLSSTGIAQALSDTAGTRYGPAFAYLQSKGAMAGYADGSGRPYDPLNRAEALKVLLEMQDKYKQRVVWYRQHMSSLPLFIDIHREDWYNAYVEAGYEAGVLNGYADRTFRPGNSLTAEEAIAMIMRAYGQVSSDGQGADWYTPYIQSALNKNLIYRYENLAVGQNVTRGQFFDMVYRMDTVAAQRLVAFVDPTPSPEQQVPAAQPQYQQPQPPPAQQTAGQSGPVAGSLLQFASQKNFAITIPRLGINDLTITHPKDALSSNGLLSVLKNGVGHLFSYPGRGGKIMIYGHSSSYSWDVSPYTKIFTKVNQLRAGDQVYVTFNGTLYVYQVTRQETISATDIRPFTGRGEELILFTCWPVGTAKYRLIVHAAPVTQLALR